MKLILERTTCGTYAYFESEKHHRYIEKHGRGDGVPVRKLKPNVLENECHLETVLSVNDYIVINLPRRPR